MSLKNFTVRAAIVIGVTATSSMAYAQATPAEAEATALIEHGVQLRQAGNDDDALNEFRRADQIFASPHAKAQIALAEQALGQWVAAERDLRVALGSTGNAWVERNRVALTQALTQIATRLGSLEIRTETPGTQISVNEQVVGTAPLAEPIRVAVGTVTIELRSPGFVTQRRSVEMTSGGRMREVFTLIHEPPSSGSNIGSNSTNASRETIPTSQSGLNPNTQASPPPQPSRLPVGGIVVAAIGGTALISTGIFAALRGGSLGQCPYDMASNTLLCPNAMATARAQSGVTWTTLANVSLVTGSLLVVGGGVWIAVSMLGSNRRDVSLSRATMVVPSVTPSSFAVTLTGAF